MNLTVLNLSTKIQDTEFQRALTAIGRQVREHFEPEWGASAVLRGIRTSLKGKAPIQGSQQAVIYVGDSSQDPTTGVKPALGYHSSNHSTIPYGFVYLNVCEKYGELWTTTLSHEVLELLADPDAVLTVAAPGPRGSATVYYDLEVCDPVQGDSYAIDGVLAANFVGRSYFGMSGGSGRTNYLGLPLDAFGVRPGGYFQYESRTGSHQIWGKDVTDAQKKAKNLMKNGRRNHRRAERQHHRKGER